MRDTRIWEVGMKKKLILMMALLCCLVLAVGILAACNGDEGTQPGGHPSGNSSAYAGRYYEQVNGNLNVDSWIELDDDWSWTDSDTMMGTFTVKGSNIYFYWMTTSEPMFGGTISNGELTIELYGTYYTYKQGAPSVDKPEEPEEEYFTVTFNVNGGDSAISSREYLAGALMSLPTPTRDGYRFLGWYDAMGRRYDNTSVMPDNDLTLTARWEIVVSSYEDEYVYFKPATEGKKQPNNFYYPFQDAGIHHYIYVELESDNIGGPNAVGDKNNLDLASRVDMEFSVEDGYTLTWYNDSSFTSINGAQMFTLDYGSNIYFLTVSEGTRVVQRYLIDFYIKHDYYISLYSNIYATRPYTNVRVPEGDTLSQNISHSSERDFEFDKWVYYNEGLDEFVEFDFDTEIREDGALYQTFAPYEITPELDGGTVAGSLYAVPYATGGSLPVPEKEGYDFLGWQLPGVTDTMNGYFAGFNGDCTGKMLGYGGGEMNDVYFSTLNAIWIAEKYVVQFDGDEASFVHTYIDVTYSDTTPGNITAINYIKEGLPVASTNYLPSSQVYAVGDAVSAPQKAGYTFLGWYDESDTKLSEAGSFDFVTPEFDADAVYIMKWQRCATKLAVSDEAAGRVSGLEGTTVVGGEATVTATPAPCYKFVEWHDEQGNVVGNEESFTFTMTAGDVTYTAVFVMDPPADSSLFAFELDDSGTGYVITDYVGDEAELVIPDEYDGLPVTGIASNAFESNKQLIVVIIPDSVTSIGEYAFNGCSSLERITVPFVGAIKDGTDNTHFGYIFGASSYDNNYAYIPASLKEVVVTGGTSIGNYAFRGCADLISVTILNSVTSIGGGAFENCSGLTSVTIGNNVTSIGESAFASCGKLIEVYNKSVLDIIAGSTDHGYVGYYAKHIYTKEGDSWFTDTEDGFRFFYDGEQGYLIGYYGSETEIDLPTSFTAYDRTLVKSYAIYKYAFEGCTDLTSATIPDSVTSIGEYAFRNCDSLTSVTIPDSVTSIGSNAFQSCSGLTSIAIPDSVTRIGNWVFASCGGLTAITIPDSVTSIGSNAFFGCSGLTSIIIGNGVTSIGRYAFYSCRSLTSVTIGNSVTSIGDHAFERCSSLTSVTIPNSVKGIREYAFAYCSTLASVSFEGTCVEWKAITLGKNWRSGSSFHQVVCSDGTVYV